MLDEQTLRGVMMPRIPAAELERLKAEVALERLVEARGIALKKRGADLVGLCPFHRLYFGRCIRPKSR